VLNKVKAVLGRFGYITEATKGDLGYIFKHRGTDVDKRTAQRPLSDSTLDMGYEELIGTLPQNVVGAARESLAWHVIRSRLQYSPPRSRHAEPESDNDDEDVVPLPISPTQVISASERFGSHHRNPGATSIPLVMGRVGHPFVITREDGVLSRSPDGLNRFLPDREVATPIREPDPQRAFPEDRWEHNPTQRGAHLQFGSWEPARFAETAGFAFDRDTEEGARSNRPTCAFRLPTVQKYADGLIPTQAFEVFTAAYLEGQNGKSNTQRRKVRKTAAERLRKSEGMLTREQLESGWTDAEIREGGKRGTNAGGGGIVQPSSSGEDSGDPTPDNSMDEMEYTTSPNNPGPLVPSQENTLDSAMEEGDEEVSSGSMTWEQTHEYATNAIQHEVSNALGASSVPPPEDSVTTHDTSDDSKRKEHAQRLAIELLERVRQHAIAQERQTARDAKSPQQTSALSHSLPEGPLPGESSEIRSSDLDSQEQASPERDRDSAESPKHPGLAGWHLAELAVEALKNDARRATLRRAEEGPARAAQAARQSFNQLGTIDEGLEGPTWGAGGKGRPTPRLRLSPSVQQQRRLDLLAAQEDELRRLDAEQAAEPPQHLCYDGDRPCICAEGSDPGWTEEAKEAYEAYEEAEAAERLQQRLQLEKERDACDHIAHIERQRQYLERQHLEHAIQQPGNSYPDQGPGPSGSGVAHQKGRSLHGHGQERDLATRQAEFFQAMTDADIKPEDVGDADAQLVRFQKWAANKRAAEKDSGFSDIPDQEARAAHQAAREAEAEAADAKAAKAAAARAARIANVPDPGQRSVTRSVAAQALPPPDPQPHVAPEYGNGRLLPPCPLSTNDEPQGPGSSPPRNDRRKPPKPQSQGCKSQEFQPKDDNPDDSENNDDQFCKIVDSPAEAASRASKGKGPAKTADAPQGNKGKEPASAGTSLKYWFADSPLKHPESVDSGDKHLRPAPSNRSTP
jgi:hypothetical protein